MLATMTTLVVMRVLLVVRDGVEFEAGRRGRWRLYRTREYLRPASQLLDMLHMHSMYCTVHFF